MKLKSHYLFTSTFLTFLAKLCFLPSFLTYFVNYQAFLIFSPSLRSFFLLSQVVVLFFLTSSTSHSCKICRLGSCQGWWRANTMCSETTSPRISFSHDLPGDGSLPIEHRRRDLTVLDSNLDFEFSISIEHESSSADELFSNGIILPIKIQSHKQSHPFEPPFTASLPPLPPTENSKQTLKQITVMNSTSSDQLEQRASESKSFWGFKRSSSLNFESRRTSLCPLPLLSRSNSTGSVPNPKSKKYKDSQKQISQKQNSTSMRKLSSSSSLNQYPTNLRPQMCKNPGGVYGNYHCINPVLNVPPKFFGLGLLLRCGKDKKSKK